MKCVKDKVLVKMGRNIYCVKYKKDIRIIKILSYTYCVQMESGEYEIVVDSSGSLIRLGRLVK